METKPKKRNPLWDILTALCTKQYPEWKDLPEELQNGYSQFMINRFICSYDYLIPVADQLATQKLTDDMHYNRCPSANGRYWPFQHTRNALNFSVPTAPTSARASTTTAPG